MSTISQNMSLYYYFVNAEHRWFNRGNFEVINDEDEVDNWPVKELEPGQELYFKEV